MTAVGRLDRLAAARQAHGVAVAAREGALVRRVVHAAFYAALVRPVAIGRTGYSVTPHRSEPAPIPTPERVLARRIVALRTGAVA